jgi:hypothetical protein
MREVETVAGIDRRDHRLPWSIRGPRIVQHDGRIRHHYA